eukprot:374821-Alexandrium_andersonii.AAC.1
MARNNAMRDAAEHALPRRRAPRLHTMARLDRRRGAADGVRAVARPACRCCGRSSFAQHVK